MNSKAYKVRHEKKIGYINMSSIEDIIKKINTKDIAEIDIDNMFLHYTNVSNIKNIFEKGLEPRIGMNAKGAEKTKKIFFTMGEQGALVIMDVWLKWLIGKPKNNYLYWIGLNFYRIPYLNIITHSIASRIFKKTQKKTYWAFKKMKSILDKSVYLVLDLKENEDFSFNDVDESKQKFKFAGEYFKHIYADDSEFYNPKMEYWNMHTYSNKIIEKDKIYLLKINDSFSANDVIKYLANKNKKYVKNNCKLLEEYLNYFD